MAFEQFQSVIQQVCDTCTSSNGGLAPLAVDIYTDENIDDDFPVIEISPSLGEIVGGKSDGTEIFDLIEVDLVALIGIFDVDDPEFSMSYRPGGRSEGSHICVTTATFWLRIFFVPQDNERAWKFDVNQLQRPNFDLED